VGLRGITQKHLEICETSRLIGKLRTLCIEVLGEILLEHKVV
jgi:hypothetical protein